MQSSASPSINGFLLKRTLYSYQANKGFLKVIKNYKHSMLLFG